MIILIEIANNWVQEKKRLQALLLEALSHVSVTNLPADVWHPDNASGRALLGLMDELLTQGRRDHFGYSQLQLGNPNPGYPLGRVVPEKGNYPAIVFVEPERIADVRSFFERTYPTIGLSVIYAKSGGLGATMKKRLAAEEVALL